MPPTSSASSLFTKHYGIPIPNIEISNKKQLPYLLYTVLIHLCKAKDQ